MMHSPLPEADRTAPVDAKRDVRLMIHRIPSSELVGASLRVVYSVVFNRSPDLNWLNAAFDFPCIGEIASHDRKYSSPFKGRTQWCLAGV